MFTCISCGLQKTGFRHSRDGGYMCTDCFAVGPPKIGKVYEVQPTLRDQFAMVVAPLMFQVTIEDYKLSGEITIDDIYRISATRVFKAADAMMAARKQNQKGDE